MNESTQPETCPRVKADEVSLLLDLVVELGLSALAVTHYLALQRTDLSGSRRRRLTQ